MERWSFGDAEPDDFAMAANPLAWEQSGNNKRSLLLLDAPKVPDAII